MVNSVSEIFKEEDASLYNYRKGQVSGCIYSFVNLYSTCLLCKNKGEIEKALRYAYRGTKFAIFILIFLNIFY